MKLTDITNLVDSTRVPSTNPLRKAIRAIDRGTKTRELMRYLKRGNNPDDRPEPIMKSGGVVIDNSRSV